MFDKVRLFCFLPKLPGASTVPKLSQPNMLVRDEIVTTTIPSEAKSKPVYIRSVNIR